MDEMTAQEAEQVLIAWIEGYRAKASGSGLATPLCVLLDELRRLNQLVSSLEEVIRRGEV